MVAMGTDGASCVGRVHEVGKVLVGDLVVVLVVLHREKSGEYIFAGVKDV